ncbi:hypothetical protein WKK05_25065 [Nostoc sp. UHCC 0302]|uniref:hypothetical protein n=1 Tax=Nostoc sp. UHCC 0302 TaxID=3134896 RepID=UPI00311C920D
MLIPFLFTAIALGLLTPNINSINGCNTSLGEDAMNRVSTNGLFVAFFFLIGVTLNSALFRFL